MIKLILVVFKRIKLMKKRYLFYIAIGVGIILFLMILSGFKKNINAMVSAELIKSGRVSIFAWDGESKKEIALIRIKYGNINSSYNNTITQRASEFVDMINKRYEEGVKVIYLKIDINSVQLKYEDGPAAYWNKSDKVLFGYE
jgi:hypothetical protein